jgi:hypothetical protein
MSPIPSLASQASAPETIAEAKAHERRRSWMKKAMTADASIQMRIEAQNIPIASSTGERPTRRWIA